MRLRSVHLASSSVEYGSLLFGLGALASLILVLTSAPSWVFYLAPVLAIPLAIRAFEAQAGHSRHVNPRIGRKRFIEPERGVLGPNLRWGAISIALGVCVAARELFGSNPFIICASMGAFVLAVIGLSRLVTTSHPPRFMAYFDVLEVRHSERGASARIPEEEAKPVKLLVFLDDSGSWVVGKPSGEPVSAGYSTREEAERAATRCLQDLDGGYVAIEGPPPPDPRE